MTIHINYSDYRLAPVTCPNCEWSGLGTDTYQNAGGLAMDLECPKCFKMLAIIDFPTYQQTLTQSNEAQRQAVLREINFKEKFKRMSLKRPNDLSDIHSSELISTFRSDTIKEKITILLNSKEKNYGVNLWYGKITNYFVEIGLIMKTKYGACMIDLVPTETAKTFLYLDSLQAPSLIDEFRKQLEG
jgi:hypothetical protein